VEREQPRVQNLAIASDPAWRFSPECVLVCIGPRPFGDRLIRTGLRVAASLEAELVVIHVETKEVNRFQMWIHTD
jgi:K+-sensing histidine kinase KdpD